MKKILIALIVAGCSYLSAEAQKAPVACGKSSGKVCKTTAGKGSYCYKTPYAQNFAVCKGHYGYFICCETPNAYNTTNPRMAIANARATDGMVAYYEPQNYQRQAARDMSVPQSQSYPTNFSINNSGSYLGYYPRKNHIKVCYAGDNVAEQNRAAYEGCATPAYDGPEKNKERNVNESNANANLAPITGRSKEGSF
jgi:hypothetical protein